MCKTVVFLLFPLDFQQCVCVCVYAILPWLIEYYSSTIVLLIRIKKVRDKFLTADPCFRV